MKAVSLPCGVLVLACLAGCSSGKAGSSGSLTPADFVRRDTPRQADPARAAASSAPAIAPDPAAPAPAPKPAPDAAENAEPAPVPGPAVLTPGDLSPYVVDAMVGQVNGQPIYARSVLEPIEAQLTAMGRQLPSDVFRNDARKLIAAKLEQIVFDNLLLGEAERDLEVKEQAGLKQLILNRREELIRKHGQGSPTVADQTLREKTGKGLEQTLIEHRQTVLIQRFLGKKLMPKIQVSRKDVERYYRDHPDEFNRPSTREIRIIRTTKAEDAVSIDESLASGTPFEQVAGSTLNTYNAADKGLMAGTQRGDAVFALKPVNEAMLALKAGEQSRRITVSTDKGQQFWWLRVETFEPARSVTLSDAQFAIDRKLRQQRYQKLTEQYRARVFKEGTYNSIEEMTRLLTDVAASRFAAK